MSSDVVDGFQRTAVVHLANHCAQAPQQDRGSHLFVCCFIFYRFQANNIAIQAALLPHSTGAEFLILAARSKKEERLVCYRLVTIFILFFNFVAGGTH
jgi:hypothetical protein